MTKKFTQAPLPFQGQKRKWFNHYEKALIEHFTDKAVFIDLFGGSGLLSYYTKQVFPSATIIFNDFDNYSERLQNVDKTNALLHKVREVLKDFPRGKKITEPYRSQLVELLKQEDYVDYITISSSLMFSMKYATKFEDFEKDTLYNNVRMSDYVVDDYLSGIDIVREDYKQLFDRYKMYNNVVFLIDPPYLSTDVSTYSENYWKLKDYLDVLHTLKDTNYFYFTSNKSSIVELCDWLESNYSAHNPFSGAIKIEMSTTMNYTTKYTDIMLYKRFK